MFFPLHSFQKRQGDKKQNIIKNNLVTLMEVQDNREYMACRVCNIWMPEMVRITPLQTSNFLSLRYCLLFELIYERRTIFICRYCCTAITRCAMNIYYMRRRNQIFGYPESNNHCLICKSTNSIVQLKIAENSSKQLVFDRLERIFILGNFIWICEACKELVNDLDELCQSVFNTELETIEMPKRKKKGQFPEYLVMSDPIKISSSASRFSVLNCWMDLELGRKSKQLKTAKSLMPPSSLSEGQYQFLLELDDVKPMHTVKNDYNVRLPLLTIPNITQKEVLELPSFLETCVITNASEEGSGENHDDSEQSDSPASLETISTDFGNDNLQQDLSFNLESLDAVFNENLSPAFPANEIKQGERLREQERLIEIKNETFECPKPVKRSKMKQVPMVWTIDGPYTATWTPTFVAVDYRKAIKKFYKCEVFGISNQQPKEEQPAISYRPNLSSFMPRLSSMFNTVDQFKIRKEFLQAKSPRPNCSTKTAAIPIQENAGNLHQEGQSSASTSESTPYRLHKYKNLQLDSGNDQKTLKLDPEKFGRNLGIYLDQLTGFIDQLPQPEACQPNSADAEDELMFIIEDLD